jgi:hypothetical protein
MQIVITDPAHVAAFNDPKQVIEFVNDKGEVIGLHSPDGFGVPPPGSTFGLSVEEYEKRRKEPAQPLNLADFFSDLERRHGKVR